MLDQRDIEGRSRPLTGEARTRALAGLPVVERRLEPAGISTAVLEGGNGPPLVLLHGGIESGSVYWAPVIPQLTESFRVVIPDLPGLGESEPVARLDDAVFVDWLSELLATTCSEPPVLLAHSLDGTLAARFAVDHGDRLRRLVIMGAPGIGPYRLPLGLVVTAIRFGLRPTERNLARFADWAFLDPARTRSQDREWYDAFTAYGLSRATVPHVKRTMRRLLKLGTKQIPDTELRRIEIPTALVWGRRDRMVPLRVAESASSRLGWALHVVDDVGHVPFVEAPEEFLRALDAVLAPSRARPAVA